MARDCRYWIEKFKEDYFQRGSSETTWRTEYHKMLKLLPSDKPLTAKLLHQLVVSTEVNTRTRIRACMVAGQLARFAKLNYDPSPYRGKYSAKSVSPRNVPSDDLIVDWYDRLKNPNWKWVYGMLITYGLRPHEAFRLDFEQLRQRDRVLWVENETKTGSRQVWAFHPEWFDEFDLHLVRLPNIQLDRTNDRVGHSATAYFSEFGLPFHLYDLRHRWAIRTLEYGLDIGLAAKQMGHSREVHERVYHRWINVTIHQRAYESILSRDDRPRPPSRKKPSKKEEGQDR